MVQEMIRNELFVGFFLRQNRWTKRGLAIVPTKFGISFTAVFLNQAGALLHIYTDGSVLLTHGGTEMGQGLHTKMVQVLELNKPSYPLTLQWTLEEAQCKSFSLNLLLASSPSLPA